MTSHTKSPSPEGESGDTRRWRIHRNKRGWPCWYQRWLEAWWIITGKWSLHRAWQNGHDDGCRHEYRRLITNRAYLAEISYLAEFRAAEIVPEDQK